MDTILLIAFFGFAVFVLYSMFSKKGRGKALGGKIRWSGKEHITQEKTQFSGQKESFQVHAIETESLSEGNKVGLELRSSSYMHISVIPISFTIEQALEVAEEIKNAALVKHT